LIPLVSMKKKTVMADLYHKTQTLEGNAVLV